jgi:signal transduction histidine kinase
VSRRPVRFPAGIVWVSLGFFVSVAALMWFGYTSTTKWKQTAALASRQSTDVAVDVLFSTLTRDMRAVESNVLPSLARAREAESGTVALPLVVSAFGLYPYPEVFFVKSSPRSEMLFYARSERPPLWLESRRSEQVFPVTTGSNSSVSRQIADRVAEDIATSRQFSVFDLAVGDHRYQVVVLITYEDVYRESARNIVGFMVDLAWIRANYVPTIVAEVSRTAGLKREVSFAIIDDRNEPVAGGTADVGAASRRAFPLLFMSPGVIAPSSLPISARSWTAVATATQFSAVRSAEAGSHEALAVSVAAAVMLIVALAVTVRAVRARTQLVEMRSDFISAVTHELKTPIAGIRALMDMLASDRVSNIDTAKTYARLGAGEVRRLARLVDNLLAYARVTDVTDIYSREPVDIRVLITDCVQHFWPQLAEGRFEEHVEIPLELPLVRVDRAAISLVLSNIVDNAIRYSGNERDLTIRISLDETKTMLLVNVIDKGVGFDEKDVSEITTQYFRGKRPSGAGLGLAIANRIVVDHGGWLAIKSASGVGTTVTVALPLAS